MEDRFGTTLSNICLHCPRPRSATTICEAIHSTWRNAFGSRWCFGSKKRFSAWRSS